LKKDSIKPDLNKLRRCMQSLAKAMDLEELPLEIHNSLVAHLLYDGEFGGIGGKNLYEDFKLDLITEREFRNVVIAHFATKLANHNHISEPDCDTYLNKELSESFDKALIGKTIDREG
jgi:hypothetical protein